MSQSDATWRVYLNEWVTFYSSDAHGPEGEAECRAHFDRKYKGRVREQDWRVTCSVTSTLGGWPYLLELRLPNLRGEFKDRMDALALPSGHSPEARIVQRGSPQEQALLEYGVKMLPATEVNGGKG